MSRRPGIGAAYLSTHKQYHNGNQTFNSKVQGTEKRLPRYYKDRMFDPWDKEHLTRKVLSDARRRELEQIKELEEHYADPIGQIEERKRHAHDAIKHKSNQNNKF